MYYAGKISNPKDVTEKETVAVRSSLNFDAELKYFPDNLLLILGACLCYHEMPSSESWMYAGKSYVARNCCRLLLGDTFDRWLHQFEASNSGNNDDGDNYDIDNTLEQAPASGEKLIVDVNGVALECATKTRASPQSMLVYTSLFDSI